LGGKKWTVSVTEVDMCVQSLQTALLDHNLECWSFRIALYFWHYSLRSRCWKLLYISFQSIFWMQIMP